MARRAIRRSERTAARADRIQWPSRFGFTVIGLAVALFLLAPPASNWFWGVNGIRSIPIPRAIVVLFLALGASSIARLAGRGHGGFAMTAIVLPLMLAFPLRERIHFLGDTGVRIGELGVFLQGIKRQPLVEWARQIHAHPLDLLINFLATATLVRITHDVLLAVSVVCSVLAVVYLAGAWRLISRLESPAPLRYPLFVALVLSGALEAFAGYDESAGLQLAAGVWWWSELIAPLDRNRQALRTTAGWVVLLLAHRIALVMVIPQLLRSLVAPFPGDQPRVRRALLGLTLAVGVAVAVGLTIGRGTGLVGSDLSDLVAALRAPGSKVILLTDTINLLALIAPLALLAPLLAGRETWTLFVRRPEAGLVAAAAIPLMPLAVLLPAVPNWMGGQREWDANVLLGLTLTLGGTALLARLPTNRLRGVLAVVIPVLVLGTASWIAVNADELASLRRAEALVSKPPSLPDGQRSHGFLYLARWAAYKGRIRDAAEYYERSYDLAPAPNRGILAAQSWANQRDFAAANRMIARVRQRGGLDSATTATVDTLESQITRARAR